MGLRAVSLTDVARTAGVSRATAYRAFGTKARMLRLVWSAEVDRLFAELRDQCSPSQTPDEVLQTVLLHTRAWLDGHPIVNRAITEELDMVGPVLVQTHSGFSFVAYTTGRVVELLESVHLERHLSVPLEQLAESVSRMMISLALAPSSVFPDAASYSRFILDGARARSRTDGNR